MKKYCLILLLSSVFSGCLDRSIDNRKLYIYNKSDNIIYFFISENDEFANPYQEYSERTINSCYLVRKDSSIYHTDNPINWEEYIQYCKDSKMRLFIVAKDSVDKYGLKEVISKSIFTKKYLVDIDYLNNNNWTITYMNK